MRVDGRSAPRARRPAARTGGPRGPELEGLEPRLLLSGTTIVTADYFPLDPGLSWSYLETEDGQIVGTENIQTVAETFNGRETVAWYRTWPEDNGEWEKDFFRLVDGEQYQDGEAGRRQEQAPADP